MATRYSEMNLAMTVSSTGKYQRYRPMLPCIDSDSPNFCHWWRGMFVGEKRETCRWCGKTKDQAREPKPMTLEEALKGN
jgi:hypothetical protein